MPRRMKQLFWPHCCSLYSGTERAREEERLRRGRELFHARRDRETDEERESRLQARSQPEEKLHMWLLQRNEARLL